MLIGQVPARGQEATPPFLPDLGFDIIGKKLKYGFFSNFAVAMTNNRQDNPQ